MDGFNYTAKVSIFVWRVSWGLPAPNSCLDRSDVVAWARVGFVVVLHFDHVWSTHIVMASLGCMRSMFERGHVLCHFPMANSLASPVEDFLMGSESGRHS